MSECDVLVVGGGAAGLSAALVLSRARRRVVVVDAGEPRNAPAAHMHGYLSRDGVSPAEFLAAGRLEVQGYGGRVLRGRVTSIRPIADGFDVRLAEGPPMTARRVLVATGLRDVLPEIAGSRIVGGGTCCTAPTATATRSAISRSLSWAVRPRPSNMPSSSGSGHPTWCCSRTRTDSPQTRANS